MTLPTVELRCDALTLRIATTVGPRILGLIPRGGPELFASLPGVTLAGAARGPFHFHGGHRLWHAPEQPARTYAPDDAPPDIAAVPGGLEVTGAPEPESGLQKQLCIELVGEGRVRVTHRLTNHAPWPVECAPWAITQFRPGGTALVPQVTTAADPDGVQPNRALVLWPYTRLDDPALRIGDRMIHVRAPSGDHRLKLGVPNPRGWLAYHLDGWLFVKRAPFDAAARYTDLGASSQLYADARFVELETLGALERVEPGDTLEHIESWSVSPLSALATRADALDAQLAALGLE